MTMQIKNGLCLLWLFVLMLLFAACSHRQKGDEPWHKDIDEFVSGHQSLMQSHPDSMIMLIRNFKCEGNPDKSDDKREPVYEGRTEEAEKVDKRKDGVRNAI
jgi:hypothetical protein